MKYDCQILGLMTRPPSHHSDSRIVVIGFLSGEALGSRALTDVEETGCHMEVVPSTVLGDDLAILGTKFYAEPDKIVGMN